jgi:hypothetical protein
VEFEGIKPNGADMDMLEDMDDESAMGNRMSSLQKAMDEYYSECFESPCC